MNHFKEEFENLLRATVEMKASDLHLSVGVPPIMRINGGLKAYGESNITPEISLNYAKAILNEAQFQHFIEHGEIDCSYGIPALSRFRLNVYHQRGAVSFAVRVIPRKIPSLEELNLPQGIGALTYKPQGLVLVTGPTGSGKSTTLASMIDLINRTQRKHIITLEDPIEYIHSHNQSVIDQREIGSDTRAFASGLRASLRQDPDVILLGEMRDLETISTAITAAETGHLVFATLHTTDAPSTVDRMIDAFPGDQQAQIRIQLASVLVAVISQRLFPLRNGSGRVSTTEIMINTPAVANLIRQEKVHQIKSILQTSRSIGMHTMEMSIQERLQSGLIDPEIARHYLPAQLEL